MFYKLNYHKIFPEKQFNDDNPDDPVMVDPEDCFYAEDEHSQDGSDDEEVDVLRLLNEVLDVEKLTEEDKHVLDEYCIIIGKFKSISSTSCKCLILKNLSVAIKVLTSLEKLHPMSSELQSAINRSVKNMGDKIKELRENLKNKESCNHQVNELNLFFKNLIDKKDLDPEEAIKYINQQRQIIQNEIQKITVAPAEKGKWLNWSDDVYLEEKLFPALFPYGIGGYLSSNIMRGSILGFSNYVKSRLLSVDEKFRKDPYYVFFLLLVKEMIEMIRSERTFFRKATRVPNLTAAALKDISKEHIFRFNGAFSAFKNNRGTAMYFQDVKKRAMAFIRQKGAPTLFCTFSCAEFQWNEMIKSIYETVKGTKVSLQFIEDQDSSWKNKLVSENVVQSTLHFNKRTEKLMSLLSQSFPCKFNDVQYHLDSYFYRVEFQVRDFFPRIINLDNNFFRPEVLPICMQCFGYVEKMEKLLHHFVKTI